MIFDSVYFLEKRVGSEISFPALPVHITNIDLDGIKDGTVFLVELSAMRRNILNQEEKVKLLAK